MDDEAALRARRVAAAASAWMREPHDARVYGRLVEAIEAWDSYVSPQLEDGGEVLDELAETNPPQLLASGVADLEALLRGAARRAL